MTEEPRQIIKYPGSKWRFAPEIISYFPKHHCFVEVFGGSAAVLLRKHPSPAEVYNDINEDLVTLFKIVRDDDMRHKLKDLLGATPHARSVLADAANTLRNEAWENELHHAYLAFILYNQSLSGIIDEDYRVNWSFTNKGKSKANDYLMYIDRLDSFAARLQQVQIECNSWERVVELYDTAKTLFYFDPPYYPETITQGMYRYDMMPHEHKQFVKAIKILKGMSIVSGYDHPLYNHLETVGWSRVESKFNMSMTVKKDASKLERTEVLWISPTAEGKKPPISRTRQVATQQAELFN